MTAPLTPGATPIPPVLGPGGGESAAVGPIGFTIKATRDDTNGMHSLVEANGPTFATPHVHHAREEAFYVVEATVDEAFRDKLAVDVGVTYPDEVTF